jgi:hypothetical protein
MGSDHLTINMQERPPEDFICYHCKEGAHKDCVGVPCHCACPIPEPPRTYEQGLADGMRRMAEAACKAVCTMCFADWLIVESYENTRFVHKQPEKGGYYDCHAARVRRAALAEGIDLSAAPREKEEG